MKLATFEIISEILPIEGADRIEIARVQGWQSVIRKGAYKVGDKVIFVPIDTVLPPAEWNKHLWDKNDPTKPIRVRSVKLKGVVSQGLIFPSSLVSAQEIWDHMDDPDEDVSIAGMLGITKYEKPIPARLAGEVKGDFPTHLVSKTDEDNLKSNIAVLDELRSAATVICRTKKDGTSGSFIKEADGTFRVCSRNLELKDTEDNVYWKMARKYNLVNILLPNTSIQAEICGVGIQKNPAGLKEVEMFVFNYKDLNTGKYHDELPEYLKGVLQTPSVCCVWTQEEFKEMDIDKLQEFTNKLLYDNQEPAEGLVFRGLTETGDLMYSKTLQKMLSVKIINQNYED